jgi:hypothetical protein
LCGQQHPKCEKFVSHTHFFKTMLFIQPHKQFRRFKQLYLGKSSELDTRSYNLLSHNNRYYHLPKYWPFLLNHPVYKTSVLTSQRTAGCPITQKGKQTNKFWNMLSLIFGGKKRNMSLLSYLLNPKLSIFYFVSVLLLPIITILTSRQFWYPLQNARSRKSTCSGNAF